MQNSMVVYIFLFQIGTPLSDKFYCKSQNCQLKLKIDTKTNSNMQNSLAVFTFSV